MVRLRWKLALVVSTYRPLSSSLSEKAMAWTTKSIRPRSSGARTAHRARLVLDVGFMDDLRASFSTIGNTRLPGGALVGEGELGASGVQGLGDTQAIDRSLATPMIRPRLPSISLATAGRSPALDGVWVAGAPEAPPPDASGAAESVRSSGIFPLVIVAREQQARVGAAEAKLFDITVCRPALSMRWRAMGYPRRRGRGSR